VSPVEDAVAQWAARNPKIKRAWMLGDAEVAVEIQPVADSEETIAVWLAKAEHWRSQLRSRLGPQVELVWIDPDRDAPALGKELEEAKVLVYERAS
jgi:hypothetical protein